ncbi:M23 family metallopeptidase [Sphingomonas sp. DG1-23]|uniref:M23 family metallopeptidase n=1 Tax=Sphingomonas sp. DG1-23 TaxID=3068316 RepID=UPI00273D22EE|nr:M23 family metallopeptidase [Sphingomonas sp. DG1-23]MDP5281388.1 M23 family metallopeptidase [Sphingomonas sp. DG1-23]
MLRHAAIPVAAAALFASGTTAPASQQVRQGFDLRVPVAPIAVTVAGRQRLVYELHLWNLARRPLALDRLEIFADDGLAADLGSDELAKRARSPLDAPRIEVPPGEHAILYLEIDGAAPALLRHRLTYTEAGNRHLVEGGAVRSVRGPLPVLDPPLRDGPWAAVYDPALDRGHRRVLYAVDGQARIPGRFAIDWMRPPEPGAAGNGAGAEVLAVADGLVATVRDDVPDPVPGKPKPAAGIGDAAGNYVSLDIGNGRFAFYEHLAKGIRVRPGQRVRAGEVIAQLGATGQADTPHLHFHLADRNSPLGAEGQPYLLRGWRQIGAYRAIEDFGAKPWTAASTRAVTAFPAPNVVVRFGVER